MQHILIEFSLAPTGEVVGAKLIPQAEDVARQEVLLGDLGLSPRAEGAIYRKFFYTWDEGCQTMTRTRTLADLVRHIREDPRHWYKVIPGMGPTLAHEVEAAMRAKGML